MLAGRLLQLSLVPLSLLLCQETKEQEVAPVAAALVSGENSDLGKCYLCYFPSSHHLSVLSGEHPWHVGLVREESKTGFLGWVRHLGNEKYNYTMNVETQ